LAGSSTILTFAAELELRRERNRSLLHFSVMNEGTQFKAIEQLMEAVIDSAAGDFLVELKLLPGNNIKAFVDGDQAIAIARLVQYNRGLYKKIEESGLFPDGDFSLEVSSPGLDEPLKMHRQYVKNINRFVEVIKKDGIKIEGKLVGVQENEMVLEEEKGKGKKKEMVLHTIPFAEVKSTKIQIKF
jgi:ribosome maturation factor RimP